MRNTDVPGLVEVGGGSFVATDLREYHEMRAQREIHKDIDELKAIVRRLKLQVIDLQREVSELRGDST